MHRPIISVKSLCKSFGDYVVLENITFDIKSNDFVAFIGPNGSGKTTLIRLLLGLLEPDHGMIHSSISTSRIGYVPQKHSIDKIFPGTVREILQGTQGVRTVEIESLLDRKFAELSGGQQQRVLIARALQQNPKLLILDEPTTGIDVEAQAEFYKLLRKLNKKGIAIVIVTHEVGVIPGLVKTVLCINRRLSCSGKPKDLPRLLKEIYGEDFMHELHQGEHHHV